MNSIIASVEPCEGNVINLIEFLYIFADKDQNINQHHCVKSDTSTLSDFMLKQGKWKL